MRITISAFKYKIMLILFFQIKGNICKGVLIRLKKNVQRDTGLSIKFSVNSLILIDAKNVPLGSRVFGPIFKEIRFGNFPKILSLAKTLL